MESGGPVPIWDGLIRERYGYKMDSGMIIEMIGYLGSVLVLISFLMSSVVKLRVINAVGSLVFAGYALIIHSYPTALMNFCLVGISGAPSAPGQAVYPDAGDGRRRNAGRLS